MIAINAPWEYGLGFEINRFFCLVMDTEIELKLLAPEGIKIDALEGLIDTLACETAQTEFSLFNQYFDTPDNELSRFGIGLRIRTSEMGSEQTVKLSGSSVGGLHQRPEYNVAVEKLEPDLELFDAAIWPEELNVPAIQGQLIQVFNTDFRRRSYQLKFADGTQIELVYDKGDISAAGHSTAISELELELKQGDPKSLFELALQIATLFPTQLGNLSKAARGFLLSRNALAPKHQPLHFVKIEAQDSCEQAFQKALSYSLEVWQNAEFRFMQSGKIADLKEVYIGVRLTLEALRMFSTLLKCNELADLQTRLEIKLRKWAWIEQVVSMKTLRSKRGAYSKKLAQHDALISYLRGLQDGILNLSRPQWLITHKDNTQLQVKLLSVMFSKPWRLVEQQETAHEVNLVSFVTQSLSQTWRPVTDRINASVMSAKDYIDSMDCLRSALLRGLFVGNLFSASRREPFRAPWLDLLDGMAELRTINLLQSKLNDSDVEDKGELISWSEVKKNNLLAVMEQSKAIALKMEPFW